MIKQNKFFIIVIVILIGMLQGCGADAGYQLGEYVILCDNNICTWFDTTGKIGTWQEYEIFVNDQYDLQEVSDKFKKLLMEHGKM